MTADKQGRPYMSSKAGILRLDGEKVVAIAGPGSAVLAGERENDERLSEPNGLAFDVKGNLHIADWGHNQVKVIPADRVLP